MDIFNSSSRKVVKASENRSFIKSLKPTDSHNALSSFYRLNVSPSKTALPRTAIKRRPRGTGQQRGQGDISSLRSRSVFDLMDSDSDDDSYMQDSDSDADVTNTHDKDRRKHRKWQTLYPSYCKAMKLVPISVFQRQLTGCTVSLKCQNLNGDTFKSIAVALLHNETVNHVELEGDAIGPEETVYLCEVLQTSQIITHLNLSGNNLGTEGLKYLVQALKDNEVLCMLNISGNGFGENDAHLVKEMLLSNNCIEELYISKNKFEDRGGQIIAEGLRKIECLKILDLSWNHIRGDGALAIGKSLMSNNTLEKLDVSWNGFETLGCHGLAHGLDKNKKLTELNISSNRIHVSGLSKILQGLKHNNTLHTFKMADNPITQQGAFLVLKVLEDLSNIKHLDLGNQPVTEEFVNLLQKIRKNRTLSVEHGKIYSALKFDDADDTVYIAGDPLVIMLEFSRMKKICIHDLFKSFDTDGSHTITWEEFKIGVKNSHIPLRPKDLDSIIKRIDINRDGEINFSELIIAQKEHDARASRLLEKGDGVFYKSPIGCVHKELHKWFSDKNVYLRRYNINAT